MVVGMGFQAFSVFLRVRYRYRSCCVVEYVTLLMVAFWAAELLYKNNSRASSNGQVRPRKNRAHTMPGLAEAQIWFLRDLRLRPLS